MTNTPSVVSTGGRPQKSFEQRLYEASLSKRGMLLSFADVAELFDDDAIATRICDAAAESSVGFGGDAKVGRQRKMSWKAFCNYMKSGG